MYVYSLNCKELVEYDIFLKLTDLISKEKKEKILKYRRAEDAQHSLFANLLSKYLIAKIYNKNFKQIKFKYNDYGKPLLDSEDNIYFNASHAGDYVVCAIDDLNIGIDIERVKDIDLKIAERFFCDEEAEYINHKNINKLDRFYEIWTMKESYIKAIGTGLSTNLKNFNVVNKDGYITYKKDNYYFKKFFIDNDYKLSICSKRKDIICEIINLNLDCFVQSLLSFIYN